MYLEMLYNRYGNALEKRASQAQRKQIEKKAAKAALNTLTGKLIGAGKSLLTQGQNLAKVKGERMLQGLNKAKLWSKNKLVNLDAKLGQYIDEIGHNNWYYGKELSDLVKFSPARTALLGGGLLGTGVAAGVGADELTRYIRENHPDILSNILGGADDATATLGNTPDALN
jgi:hypothetical protein